MMMMTVTWTFVRLQNIVTMIITASNLLLTSKSFVTCPCSLFYHCFSSEKMEILFTFKPKPKK